MTLEGCIEYFEIEAKMSDSLMIPYESRKKYSDDCKQMAKWMRELKAYREDTRFADLYERICIKRDEDRDYFARTKDQTYITRIAEKEMFIHMMQDMMFDRYCGEEVNADEESE